MAQTNLLELKEEGRLFDELMELISSVLKKKKGFSVKEHQEIICSTEAIRTALCQHMSKEEDVVRPCFHTLKKVLIIVKNCLYSWDVKIDYKCFS